MIKKNLIVIGTLAFVVGAGFYINNDQKENTAVMVENQEDLAIEKVKELNARVANGEEEILLNSAIFPDYSKEELFEEADLVVKGTIESVEKEYMVHTDIPFTDFKFNVEEYWKSDLREEDNFINQLIITQDGNTQLAFKEHPLMSIGEEYVLFLKRVLDNNEEKLVLLGGPEGNFRVDEDVIAEEIDKENVNGVSVDEFLKASSEDEITEAITKIETE